MLTANATSSFQISHFVLICFPNIQSWQHWLSIPLALLLLSAIVANILILAVIQRERHLHEPMYFFIALLAILDLVVCLSTIPKILGILWFNWKLIDLHACFLQMYFVNSFVPSQSATFLVMAFDRYTAICNPLHYPSVISSRFVSQAFAFILLRNLLVGIGNPVLAARLPYCSRNIIENCICGVISVTSLACGDSTINKLYQLATGFILLGIDFIFISMSYCMIFRVVMKLQAEGAAATAFSTCTPHFILISFFYTLLLVLIFTNTMRKKIPPDVPILLNVFHFVVPSAMNPIVYGLRSKDIKQGIKKMIGKGNTNLNVKDNATN
ncbi:olfactory receptor 56A4-like [Lissotriton helveticus]